MLQFEPCNRPLTERIAKHPFFWSKKYLLSFLSEISDLLESFSLDDPIFENLEKNGRSVIGVSIDPNTKNNHPNPNQPNPNPNPNPNPKIK